MADRFRAEKERGSCDCVAIGFVDSFPRFSFLPGVPLSAVRPMFTIHLSLSSVPCRRRTMPNPFVIFPSVSIAGANQFSRRAHARPPPDSFVHCGKHGAWHPARAMHWQGIDFPEERFTALHPPSARATPFSPIYNACRHRTLRRSAHVPSATFPFLHTIAQRSRCNPFESSRRVGERSATKEYSLASGPKYGNSASAMVCRRSVPRAAIPLPRRTSAVPRRAVPARQ